MHKVPWFAAVAFAVVQLAAAPNAPAAEQRLGIGANYWKTVNDLGPEDVKHIDKDGLSWLASYQYAPAGIFTFEADLEYLPNLGDGDKPVLAPQVFVLVGGGLYAGAGAGYFYYDGTWGDKPFFVLRAGFDIQVLPFLYLDINANYRFKDWDTLHGSDLNTSTITLGAAARFSL